jgi:spoIIIJ-associated protein
MERVGTGRTVEEAVGAALAALGVERDLCSVEVLEEPSRGLFGLLAAREARVRVAVTAGKSAVAASFLRTATRLMGAEARVERSDEDEEGVHIELDGSDAAALIGRHGQTLDALQVLADACATRRCDDRRRLSVDVNGYRRRRRRSLEDLARRAARQVRRSGRSIELDPMPASERRIVHLALQDEPGVVTESAGEEPNRRVVVRPAG